MIAEPHDLFDRRYAIYAATREFLRQICQKRTITIQELSDFDHASGDAIFVLDQKISAYLEQVRKQAARAAELHEKITDQTALPGEIDEHWSLLSGLSAQIDQLGNEFRPFLQFSRPWSKRLRTLGVAALALALCMGAAVAEKTRSPPTATEVLHLRSQCAALGRKILDTDIFGPALYKSQLSLYNPQTNRCYVELTAQTADATRPPDYLSRSLYDGQTGEMLAVAQMKNGQKWGIVYDQNHKPASLTEAGWDDANQYIDAMMADDRKQ